MTYPNTIDVELARKQARYLAGAAYARGDRDKGSYWIGELVNIENGAISAYRVKKEFGTDQDDT